MRFGRKGLWMTVALVLLLAALAAVFLLRSRRVRVKMIPMSVHDRVTDVVQAWARMPSLPDDKQELEVIWDTSGPQYEFYPWGAENLATRLQTEFHDSKTKVVLFTDIHASKNPGGKINTVDDLATFVRRHYRPQ